MAKTLNIPLTDNEYETLKIAKGKKKWKEFLLSKATEETND